MSQRSRSSDYSTGYRRPKPIDEAEAERLAIARRAQDIEVARGRKAFSEAEKQRQAAMETEKMREQGLQRRSRTAAVSNMVTSGNMDPKEAVKYLGGGDEGGTSGTLLRRQPVPMEEQRRRRLLNESQYLQGQRRYYQTHSGEAARGGTMEVPAAPGSPTLIASGQQAAGAGMLAREQRNAYESSTPFIRGLAELKMARNASLMQSAQNEQNYQASAGSFGGQQNDQARQDYLAASARESRPGMTAPYEPNMQQTPQALTGPEAKAYSTPGQPLATPQAGTAPLPQAGPQGGAVSATPAQPGAEVDWGALMKKQVDQAVEKLRTAQPGTQEASKARQALAILQRAQGLTAEQEVPKAAIPAGPAPQNPNQDLYSDYNETANQAMPPGYTTQNIDTQRAYELRNGVPMQKNGGIGASSGAAAGAAAGAASNPDSYQGQMENARQAERAGNTGEAERIRRDASTRYPDQTPEGQAEQAGQDFMRYLDEQIDYFSQRAREAGKTSPGGEATQEKLTPWQRMQQLKERGMGADIAGKEAETAAKRSAEQRAADEAAYIKASRLEPAIVKTATEKKMSNELAVAETDLRLKKATAEKAENELSRDPENAALEIKAKKARIAESEAAANLADANAKLAVAQAKAVGSTPTPDQIASIEASAALTAIGTPSMGLDEAGFSYQNRIDRSVSRINSMLDNAPAGAARKAVAAGIAKQLSENGWVDFEPTSAWNLASPATAPKGVAGRWEGSRLSAIQKAVDRVAKTAQTGE